MYDLNLINEYLNTKYIGRTIMQFDELKSTGTKARSIFNSCPDGTVILSENQTKCKVRFSNEWYSLPEKNVYMSIILKPDISECMISKYESIASASVCESIEGILNNIECEIKWPNDIRINSKKVSSIYCEAVKIKNDDAGIIINICVNVNLDNDELDKIEEDLNATSLKIENQENIEREMLIGNILNNFERLNDEFLNQGTIHNSIELCTLKSKMINNYINVNKFGKKTVKRVIVKGIDENGNLVVVNDKGEEEIIDSGVSTVKYE